MGRAFREVRSVRASPSLSSCRLHQQVIISPSPSAGQFNRQGFIKLALCWYCQRPLRHTLRFAWVTLPKPNRRCARGSLQANNRLTLGRNLIAFALFLNRKSEF
jgi:hypothetical protein